MSEQPTNTYSREHPGHTEPDRYLDDEGRCTFCGRALREAENARLQERVESLDTDLTEIATTMTEHFDMVDLNDLPVSLTKGIKALLSREGELVAALVKDIEQLRDIAHEWFEEDRLTKEALDNFCAIGPTYQKCPTCKGNGRVELLEHCPDCDGSGMVLAAALAQGKKE